MRFSLSRASADASTVARVREELGRWLRREVDLDEPRLCDVTLAVNEALANVVEFAYLDCGGIGTFDMDAVHHPQRAELAVEIRDLGRWRATDPLLTARNRGRGLALMRTLADAVVIDTSSLGTSVCLRFGNVHAAGRMAESVCSSVGPPQ